MSLLQRGLMFVLAAGTLAIPSSVPPETRAGGRAAVTVDPQTVSVYTPADKEYYLTEAQVDFIRPGLKLTIGAVTDMAPGKKPTIEITMVDDLNQPLDRLGGTTPGVVSVRFVPAVFDVASNYYTNLLESSNGNPTRDNTGTWVDLGAGKYKYTFALTLPAFDVNKPMTLFAGANRNMTAYIGKTYYATAYKDFVPATNAAATTWNVMPLAKCNACHDPLALHGGNYSDLKTCVLCHNNNNMSEPNLAEFNMGFWHAIHSSNTESIGEITYPQAYLNNCEACHDPKATQGTVYLTKPSRIGCGSCHAGVNFDTGEGHSAGGIVQIDDSKCAECHQPDSGQEYDASIKGAHVLIYKSKQLKGLNAEIISVTDTAPGKNPIVTFKLTENDGKIVDPAKIGTSPTCSIKVAGPTTDYATWPAVAESAVAATFNGTTASFKMAWKVPEAFKGSLAFSLDVRRTVTLNAGTSKERTFREAAFNPIFYVASTGTVVERRTIISQAKCLACHGELALHGGQRRNVLYCSLCHNPNSSDRATPPESVDFRRMIHRLHTGENLTQPYYVGFDFQEVTYPGDRRNCLACHTSQATADLPVVTGALNVVTLRDYFTPQGPGTAACLGCHDTRDAAAHAYLNTAIFGEACGACHGANSEWSVATVHAR
jgi:OmcA/MtrC family decaheme c-type cytochrome